jgi:hypothetical protein
MTDETIELCSHDEFKNLSLSFSPFYNLRGSLTFLSCSVCFFTFSDALKKSLLIEPSICRGIYRQAGHLQWHNSN